MSQVKTVEQLRKVLPEPRETTKAKILPFLDEQAIDFLKTCPFGLMATAGRYGPIEVSPKGDEPGFVHVENETTVLLPERAGNNLAFGLQNIIETGRIGMIFLRPRTGETLRLSGRAEIFDDAEFVGRIWKVRPPGAAGDPDPHRAVLFPLRAFGDPSKALGAGALARSQAHLVRKDFCGADRRRRGSGGENRRLCRAGIHDQSVVQWLTRAFLSEGYGRHKKLCGSTSTSSLRLPLVFGPAASHSRKYSDTSTLRSDFTKSRNR